MRESINTDACSRLWKIARKAMFLLDAEKAHQLGTIGIRLGIGALRDEALSYQPRKVFGIDFLNSIGLAAGFDKDGDLIEQISRYGFGSIEIGSVTPLPQPGNPKPRMYRVTHEAGLWNAMGFNSRGMNYVRSRLEEVRARQSLPTFFRIGVNLGKNKDTPIKDAGKDYAKVAKSLAHLSDYLVINISSPNTPALRDLQTPSYIRELVEGVKNESKDKPVLVKVAPEITGDALSELLHAGDKAGVDGWVLTNTLAVKPPHGAHTQMEVGGLSGGPLREISFQRLCEARLLTLKPIISVGGVGGAEEIKRRVSNGASLVQFYSAWVYQGPDVVTRMLTELSHDID